MSVETGAVQETHIPIVALLRRGLSLRKTVSGDRKMGSRNGLNVRTMRTRFPLGRKGGAPQQENRLGLGLGMRTKEVRQKR